MDRAVHWLGGADKLDPEGQHHGLWVRFRRFVEGRFDEGHDLLHKAEDTLRAGGAVVEVFTRGETSKKERAGVVLKAAGATGVQPWGRAMTESM